MPDRQVYSRCRMTPGLWVVAALAWTALALLAGVLIGGSVDLADKLDAALETYDVESPAEEAA